MNENQFWASIWKGIFAVIMVLAASVGGCTAYESSLVRDMVSKGADPLTARCGISPGNTSIMCNVIAAKVTK